MSWTLLLVDFKRLSPSFLPLMKPWWWCTEQEHSALYNLLKSLYQLAVFYNPVISSSYFVVDVYEVAWMSHGNDACGGVFPEQVLPPQWRWLHRTGFATGNSVPYSTPVVVASIVPWSALVYHLRRDSLITNSTASPTNILSYRSPRHCETRAGG